MTTPTTTPKFIALGTTDSVCTCDCCGRTDLKKTVALGLTDTDGNWTGDVTYYGTTCAARALAPMKSFTHATATTMVNGRTYRDRREASSRAYDALVSWCRENLPAYKDCRDRSVPPVSWFRTMEERGNWTDGVRLHDNWQRLAGNRPL